MTVKIIDIRPDKNTGKRSHKRGFTVLFPPFEFFGRLLINFTNQL
jgi:hypothetical protein